MNLGQEEEEEDSSSQETCAEVEHHQLHPEEEDEEEKENKEDEAGLLLAASAIPSPNHGFPSNKNNNPSSSFQSPPPPSVIPYKDFFPEHHASLLWHDLSHRRLDLVDLSLGSSNGGGAAGPSMEHMFDKVVTPSDVGKLNRLVIPKQHAEKYFPLDSSSNDNGLLLNFEDRNGKPWRFRYSYWNSSQSYVMTKGWSRFVKENKLDAGDIVSFQRGVGEAGKHRLYIDWRRRPNAPDPLPFPHQHNHHLDLQLHFPQSVRWGTLYSLPQSLSNYPTSSARQYDYPHHPPPRHHHDQQLDYGTINHPYGPNLQYQQQQRQYYLSPPGTTAQYPIAVGMRGEQMVIDSVPVVHGKKVGKRLRLFGVNMECQPDDASSFSMDVRYPYHHQQQQQQRGRMISSIPSPHHSYLSSSSSSSSNIPRLQFQGLPAAATGTTTSTTSQMAMQQHHRQQQEYSKKGKTASSLSFDLDL